MAIVVAVGVAPRCSDRKGKIGRKTPKPVMPISTTPASANIDPVREAMGAVSAFGGAALGRVQRGGGHGLRDRNVLRGGRHELRRNVPRGDLRERRRRMHELRCRKVLRRRSLELLHVPERDLFDGRHGVLLELHTRVPRLAERRDRLDDLREVRRR